MKIAIVHYWLVDMRGGERVLETLCELFPDADVITNIYRPERLSSNLSTRKVITTFVDRLPFAGRGRAAYLPLMPLALEQVDLRAYDFVISVESGPAKGVIPRLDAPHLCYCLSPMRYAWDHYHQSVLELGPIARVGARAAMHYLRAWDQLSAARVDRFVAISRHVQRRIQRYYNRRSDLLAPPVRVRDFDGSRRRDDFFLYVGELVGYKRADLAVEACESLGVPLVVIGRGPLESVLRKRHARNVTILGWQPDDVVRDYLSRCRALLFPGEEDFGLTPVEAMASGAPVIAYAAGGVLDTVVDGLTGVFFNEPTAASLASAMRRFLSMPDFDAEALRTHATMFDVGPFQERFKALVDETFADPRMWRG